MKRILLIAALAVSVVVVPNANAFYMNFEEGLGHDFEYIIGIPGVHFDNSAGSPWRYADITTDGYNAYSIDNGVGYGSGAYQMYGWVAAWAGVEGNGGRITFDDQNGTWFQTGITSYSDFYLDAFDAGGNWLDGAQLIGGNTFGSDMAWLRVDAPTGTTIAYVTLHDSGNYWIADNMSGDMAGGLPPVPEPASLLLLGAGLGICGIVARRRRN